MPLGKQGRADAMAQYEEHDIGPMCLGAPELGIKGCGKVRAALFRRVTDPRLRWCCAECAAKGAR